MWNYNLVTGLGNESLSIQCESVFKCLESMVNLEVRETLLGTVGVTKGHARSSHVGGVGSAVTGTPSRTWTLAPLAW